MSEKKPGNDPSRKRQIPTFRAGVGIIELVSDRDLAGEPLPPLVELIPCGPPKIHPADQPSNRPIPTFAAGVGVIELRSDRELAGEPLPPLVELIPCGPPKVRVDDDPTQPPPS